MIITPRTLRGFRDFLPAAMIQREWVMDTARRVYRSFGFVPMDTPVLEYLDILLGKGSAETDRQLYHFHDHGNRAVGMRFDLTVPLARFVAQHLPELGIPFKRYHLAKVWRGENTQHGRYREFMQCDFDTVGTTSLLSDAEMIVVVHELLLALGVERFTIRVNHRQLLSGILEHVQLSERAPEILRALDKLGKTGPGAVAAEMQEVAGATEKQSSTLLQFASISGSPQQVFSQVVPWIEGTVAGESGLHALESIMADLTAAGLPDTRYSLDLSIARGLDYYSGTVIETQLDDLPQIGSVCSGGRYDDLASLYTRERLPGVGASLGLDRMLAAMEELQLLPKTAAVAPVLIVQFDASFRNRYWQLAMRLRRAGIGVEVYAEPKKLAAQLKYAAQQGFHVALIAGSNEFASGSCQVKFLESRSTQEVSLDGDELEKTVAAAIRGR